MCLFSKLPPIPALTTDLLAFTLCRSRSFDKLNLRKCAYWLRVKREDAAAEVRPVLSEGSVGFWEGAVLVAEFSFERPGGHGYCVTERKSMYPTAQ